MTVSDHVEIGCQNGITDSFMMSVKCSRSFKRYLVRYGLVFKGCSYVANVSWRVSFRLEWRLSYSHCLVL